MIADIAGGRRWFHGSVWRYDFVMGANRKSLGLDVNILILCLIVFGVKEENTLPQPGSTGIINDLPGKKRAAPKEKKKPADPITEILTALFGQNASRVRSIFVTSDSYAGLFSTHSEKWADTSVETKQSRASEAYWTGASLVSPARGSVRRSRDT